MQSRAKKARLGNGSSRSNIAPRGQAPWWRLPVGVTRYQMTPALPTTAPLLALRGISKRFGGVVALDGVDFELRAGRSTPCSARTARENRPSSRCSAASTGPMRATIRVAGGPVPDRERGRCRPAGHPAHPPGAGAARRTCPSPRTSFWAAKPRPFRPARPPPAGGGCRALVATSWDCSEMRRRARVRVRELNVAQRQLVEIARRWRSVSRILVLDEPTASLCESETEALFGKLRRLRGARGGHHLHLAPARGDQPPGRPHHRPARRPQHRHPARRRYSTPEQLIRWMVGRELKDITPVRPNPGEVALAVRGLRERRRARRELRAPMRRGPRRWPGLVGAGRTDVGARARRARAGDRRGENAVGGRPGDDPQPAADARAAGIVLVPEDRKREGLVMTQIRRVQPGVAVDRDWWAQRSSARLPARAAIVARAMSGFAHHAPAAPTRSRHALRAATSRRWSSADGWSSRRGS